MLEESCEQETTINKNQTRCLVPSSHYNYLWQQWLLANIGELSFPAPWQPHWENLGQLTNHKFPSEVSCVPFKMPANVYHRSLTFSDQTMWSGSTSTFNDEVVWKGVHEINPTSTSKGLEMPEVDTKQQTVPSTKSPGKSTTTEHTSDLSCPTAHPPTKRRARWGPRNSCARNRLCLGISHFSFQALVHIWTFCWRGSEEQTHALQGVELFVAGAPGEPSMLLLGSVETCWDDPYGLGMYLCGHHASAGGDKTKEIAEIFGEALQPYF